jgi:hypothetical protein
MAARCRRTSGGTADSGVRPDAEAGLVREGAGLPDDCGADRADGGAAASAVPAPAHAAIIAVVTAVAAAIADLPRRRERSQPKEWLLTTGS